MGDFQNVFVFFLSKDTSLVKLVRIQRVFALRQRVRQADRQTDRQTPSQT